MADPRDDDARETPLSERILDLFVFIPAGIAVSVAEEIPKLATRGRERIGVRVSSARAVGRFAVKAGRHEFIRRSDGLFHLAGDLSTARRSSSDTAKSKGGVFEAVPVRTAPQPPVRSWPSRGNGHVPAVSTLSIPGFDTLSASQVVQRLDGLNRVELVSVRPMRPPPAAGARSSTGSTNSSMSGRSPQSRGTSSRRDSMEAVREATVGDDHRLLQLAEELVGGITSQRGARCWWIHNISAVMRASASDESTNCSGMPGPWLWSVPSTRRSSDLRCATSKTAVVMDGAGSSTRATWSRAGGSGGGAPAPGRCAVLVGRAWLPGCGRHRPARRPGGEELL